MGTKKVLSSLGIGLFCIVFLPAILFLKLTGVFGEPTSYSDGLARAVAAWFTFTAYFCLLMIVVMGLILA